MAGYTRVNLEQVDNAAERFGLAPDMEARFASRPLELERSGVSLQRLAPGFRQPFGHRHREQEEVYVVVEGSARVKLDVEVLELGRLDALRVAPETARCFESSPDGATIVAFGAPAGAGPAADAE